MTDQTITADVAPADAAPADVAPADVAPADAAPADAAPADAAPADAAPADAAYDLSRLPEHLRADTMAAAMDKVLAHLAASAPPADAAGYAFTPDPALAAYFEPDDPMLAAFREVAHANGLPAASFGPLVSQFMAKAIAMGAVAEPVDFAAVMKALDPNPIRAHQRVADLDAALTLAVGNGVLTKAERAELDLLALRPEGVRALEKIMSLAPQERALPAGVGNLVPSKDELQTMMRDPRYNTDPEYTARVSAGFQARAAAKRAGQ